MKTVAQIAFKDIGKHINENTMNYNPLEVWDVRPSHLNTKENRRLNRELGLRGINTRIENTYKS